MTTTPYQIQTIGRQCARTGRPLATGEKFYSVLTEEAGQFVRKDYAADAWTGPPVGAIGFWAGRVPAQEAPRRPTTINEEVLLDCFRHLADIAEPSRLHFRYVLALLLMRRRRLQFEDVLKEDGRDLLCLRDARTGTRHRVVDPRLTEEQMQAVQDEVFQVLGWA